MMEPDRPLNREEMESLLGLAREAVSFRLRGGKRTRGKPAFPFLSEKRASKMTGENHPSGHPPSDMPIGRDSE